MKVCFFGCLPDNHAETTEQIVMKFDIQTSYELTEMIWHFASHGNVVKASIRSNLGISQSRWKYWMDCDEIRFRYRDRVWVDWGNRTLFTPRERSQSLYQKQVAYTAKHLHTYKLSLLSVCLFTLYSEGYTLQMLSYFETITRRVYPTVCVVTVSSVWRGTFSLRNHFEQFMSITTFGWFLRVILSTICFYRSVEIDVK